MLMSFRKSRAEYYLAKRVLVAVQGLTISALRAARGRGLMRI
jgi:hypothetical protein